MASFFATNRSWPALALAAALVSGPTLAAVELSAAAPAFAQDQPAAGPPPAAGGRQRMGKILMSLGLSDSQKSQIRSIMSDTRKQNANVTDRDVRRANYKAAMAKVEAILTPAQRTELHAKMDAMRQSDQAPHS